MQLRRVALGCWASKQSRRVIGDLHPPTLRPRTRMRGPPIAVPVKNSAGGGLAGENPGRSPEGSRVSGSDAFP
jgi:hypothetical protein